MQIAHGCSQRAIALNQVSFMAKLTSAGMRNYIHTDIRVDLGEGLHQRIPLPRHHKKLRSTPATGRVEVD
eukprot:scaffold187987_cov28-Tisochrysis_lutea.AAC.2